MGALTIAAAVAYVFAFLTARGWLVTQSLSWAVALVALGLLCSLLAGLGPVVRAWTPPRPPQA